MPEVRLYAVPPGVALREKATAAVGQYGPNPPLTRLKHHRPTVAARASHRCETHAPRMRHERITAAVRQSTESVATTIHTKIRQESCVHPALERRSPDRRQHKRRHHQNRLYTGRRQRKLQRGKKRQVLSSGTYWTVCGSKSQPDRIRLLFGQRDYPRPPKRVLLRLQHVPVRMAGRNSPALQPPVAQAGLRTLPDQRMRL